MKPEHMLLQDSAWSSLQFSGLSVVRIAGEWRKRRWYEGENVLRHRSINRVV